jgi:flagellar hook-associated protein 3 FlgL
MERSDRFVASISDAGRKNDTQYQSVQRIIDLANSFKQNLATESTSTSGSVNDLNSIGNSSLDSIRDALNVKDGANFLFGGSKTNIAPVDDLKLGTNLDGTIPTASYYNGDDFKASVDVSSSLRVEYGISASDPTFQKLIGAINMAKQQENLGSGANYTDASNMLDAAISDLITMQAKMGDNAKTLEDSSTFHTTAKATFEQKYAEANSPDVVQLTIETSQLQTTLEASFSAFSKISQLSLINFL